MRNLAILGLKSFLEHPSARAELILVTRIFSGAENYLSIEDDDDMIPTMSEIAIVFPFNFWKLLPDSA